MKKTVVITGAAGFIGSHLCRYLLEKDYSVIGIDNFITGQKKNIEALFSNPDFNFIEHDITKYIDITGSVDYIMHFASPASPIDFPKVPIQILKVNALGTHNVMGLAKEKKARVLIASTSEVYGDPLVHPQPETYLGNVNPIGIRGVYDEAKRFAESMTMAYHRIHGVDTRIMRIFNTYGPHMRGDDGRVVPNFILQAFQNKPLTVYGDGSQTRSFCYVSDNIEGGYRLLMSDYTDPVNIGSTFEITILEFAQLIIELSGSKSEIRYEPLPEGDPKMRRPDLSRANNILQWKPMVGIRDGLKATINWFRDELQ